MADYSINKNIHDEPDFSWCVPYIRKKSTTILVKVKSKYWQRTHNCGIKTPEYVNEAYNINAENRNNYWCYAINQDMEKVGVAFK